MRHQENDSCADLFRMDGYRRTMAEPAYCDDYPYLTCAAYHTGNLPVPADQLTPTYPMSSETLVSQANYENQRPYFPYLASVRCCAPHTRHAAELFLYLPESGK